MNTSRNIILLSDGTGNARGKLEQTNVWRTCEAIDLKDASSCAAPAARATGPTPSASAAAH